MRELTEEELKLGNFTLDSSKSSLINRKPFDIIRHEVYDHISVFDADNLVVEDAKWIINKDRAIAIAKHFGLTAEDLK